MLWDSALMLWVGLVLLAVSALLALEAVLHHRSEQRAAKNLGEPSGHKPEPRRAFEDWT